jgi:hypothetical protein
VIDFLTVTLGDIVIGLSAFITVGGSYRLYSQRQRDRNDRLRNALYAEMVKSGDRSDLQDSKRDEDERVD